MCWQKYASRRQARDAKEGSPVMDMPAAADEWIGSEDGESKMWN